MKFNLPTLSYDRKALEPHISAETIDFHYGKHHQAYINNLNNLIEDTEFSDMDLEDIILNAEGGLFNNAAQAWNHTFYFGQFSPDTQNVPSGNIASLIDKNFGSFEAFKVVFSKAASTLFGSGWAWLVLDETGGLVIMQTVNAANPLTEGLTPLMVCDVWEHAYYIDYRNKRPDYINSFWKIIDWSIIEKRLVCAQ